MSTLAPEELGEPGTKWPVADAQLANVHRIRIEAYGPSVAAVSQALQAAAARMQGINGDDSLWTAQEVYERDVNEPDGGSTAYKGRLIVNPAITLTTQEEPKHG